MLCSIYNDCDDDDDDDDNNDGGGGGGGDCDGHIRSSYSDNTKKSAAKAVRKRLLNKDRCTKSKNYPVPVKP
jgi:hypothetical protein